MPPINKPPKTAKSPSPTIKEDYPKKTLKN
jgi:hypothetical protein